MVKLTSPGTEVQTYSSRQKTTFANNSISELSDLLKRLGAKHIFFVTDKSAYELSGAAEALKDCLKNYSVVWFCDFELNPKFEDVEVGIELFRRSATDVVVALGGGSALDMAKLIAGCGIQKESALDYILGKRVLVQQLPPLIAIPTTAGTGSEATHFAVVYLDDQKYSLANPQLLPDYVLIDPQLTYTLPRKPTAAGGLDALCQAIESIWSVGATNESIGYASEALSLALDNLEAVVNKPTPEARIAMSKAANLAGKAINITKTTAPHALSYAITSQFHVPHGIAVALTIGAFLEYNCLVNDSDCTDPRGTAAVRERMGLIVKILGDGSMEQAQFRLNSIKENVGCPMSLSMAGIAKADVVELAGKVNAERLSNNPRRIDDSGLSELLNTVL